MERDFKGIWIPKEVYLNKELNWTDKILLVEINSLDNEDGCFASNEYFAEFLDVSTTTISKSISKLISFGFMYIESFDGRKRVLKTNIDFNLTSKQSDNLKAEFNQTSKQPKSKLKSSLKENLIYNNTINNTTNNTNKDKAEASANFIKMKEVYFNFYESLFNFKPTFQAIDGKMIKEIEAKIINICNQKSLVITEKLVVGSFTKVLDYASKDKWLKENFLLKNINSQFNKIINYGTKQEGQRIELDEETAKYFG
jgi:biotin operon repressor